MKTSLTDAGALCMIVGIVENRSKTESGFYAAQLAETFEKHGVQVVSADSDRAASEKKLYEISDIIISIGGDGTFLHAAAAAIRRGIPVFGFNLGRLGFLTEFDKDNIDATVRKIVSHDYNIEERRVLSVSIEKNGEKHFFGYALNDCVTKEMTLNMAYLTLHINDILVDTYPCDGMIVATQTGSTAYSLSAGGPIIEPGNDVVLITPICSHSMGSRAIVARPESSVRISPCGKAKDLNVIVDGYLSRKLGEDECVLCERTEQKVKIIRIDPPNFYTTVRKKLLARGDGKETE